MDVHVSLKSSAQANCNFMISGVRFTFHPHVLAGDTLTREIRGVLKGRDFFFVKDRP